MSDPGEGEKENKEDSGGKKDDKKKDDKKKDDKKKEDKKKDDKKKEDKKKDDKPGGKKGEAHDSRTDGLVQSPPPLEEWDIVSDTDLEEWIVQTKGLGDFEFIEKEPYLYKLFPLCSQFQFFKEMEINHGFKQVSILQHSITTGIREICKEFSKAPDNSTALKQWGMTEVFPALSSSHHSNTVRFFSYLDQLTEITTIINLCESLYTSIFFYLNGKKHRFFKFMGHQLAVIFFFLKRTAPTLCTQIDEHFPQIRKVWENNDLPASELEWLRTFLKVVLTNLYALSRKAYITSFSAGSLHTRSPSSSSSSASSSSSSSASSSSSSSSSSSAASSPSSSSSAADTPPGAEGSPPAVTHTALGVSPFINSFQFLFQVVSFAAK